ncbi:substrate-binding periplasmic protein [Halopseudomonas salegens]|uniref:Amino acid ABC transporter substrate-binding protein, PAAT family n=1 Tax=Halopseudomonas salegens TaxID=1434072 RepID=A0A1H2HGH2_9GAMM|nr:ABC transporter substrate-binding protein [Halopseudomonas salegens]SDU30648.1 amino acid ABC transporter substrate-binding protein, PAAT family [Halopseudomonas salegens]
MIRRFAGWRWLLFTCLLTFGGSLAATPSGSTSAPLQVLVADVWPWAYEDEQQELRGLLPDLFAELASISGQALNVRRLPHQRLLHDFERGQGDLSILFANPEVDRFAARSAPILSTRFMLVAPRDSAGELSLSALSGKTVAYIRGTFYGSAFEANQSIIKIPVHHLEQAVAMLQVGRLDALISSEQVLHYTLQEIGSPADDWRIELHAEEQMAYLYRHRENVPASRIEPLLAALEQLRASGELQRLMGAPSPR